MITVCLLTCDRPEYTAYTLQTFRRFNDLSRFALIHADDASTDQRNLTLPAALGFETIARSTRRQGWLEMRRRLFQAAAARGAEWVLFLENDIQWARPFPWALFEYMRRYPMFYCLRLQGEFKDRARTDRCMIYHKDDRRKPVKWARIKFAPEPAQAARIHWSAQPSVTRIHELLNLHEYRMEAADRTVRVVENVTYHIGALRTSDLAVSA